MFDQCMAKSHVGYIALMVVLGLLFIGNGAEAQLATLEGRVVDVGGEPLFGASVFLVQDRLHGVVTDGDGAFKLRFADTSRLTDTLCAMYMGYGTLRMPLQEALSLRPLVLVLREDEVSLRAVVVRANPSATREYAVKKVSKWDVYSAPDAAGDALKMVTLMPSSTSESSERAEPELRGSSSALSRVVLNGVPLYKPVRMLDIEGSGIFSILSTDAIAEQRVYASNPPLIYGNALAGLVEVETAKEQHRRETAVGLGLSSVGTIHQQPIGKSAFIYTAANYQHSAPYLWVNQLPEVKEFQSADLGLNIHAALTKDLTLNLYSFGIWERYAAEQRTLWGLPLPMEYAEWRNFNILNLKQRLGMGYLTLNFGTDIWNSRFSWGQVKPNERWYSTYTNLDYIHYLTPDWTLQVGLLHDWKQANYACTFPQFTYAPDRAEGNYSFTNIAKQHVGELYAYSSAKLTPFLHLGGGTRVKLPVFGQQWDWSLQGNLRCDLTSDFWVQASAGRYGGYLPPNAETQQFLPASSQQYALEMQTSWQTMTWFMAGYYKQENALEAPTDQNIAQEVLRRIAGFEFNYRWVFSPCLLSFSYTYLNSCIRIHDTWYLARNALDYLLRGSFQFTNRWVGTLSLACMYRPGMRYTPIVHGVPNELPDYSRPVYGEYFSRQLDDYFTLNFSWSLPIVLPKAILVVYASATNLLGRKNQMAQYYAPDYSQPTDYCYYAPRSYYFGCQVRF